MLYPKEINIKTMGYTEMIIYSEDYLWKDNAYGATQVQIINGDYMNSEFIIDRIYYGEYTGKNGGYIMNLIDGNMT